METLFALFSEHSFMPHGHCYLWTPSLLWLQVLTNGLIGLSYVAISLTLVNFMRRADDLPLRFLYVAFGVFIIACGVTHFMDVWVIWQPRYWLDGSLRLITALASVGTAFVLPRFVPHAVMLLQGAQRMRREGVALEKAMNDLSTLYARTRELDQRKTDFFANVSHELRTPITLILAPVENLLRRTDLSEDTRSQLDMVWRNARGLLGHVNDLLDVQKLDAGKLTLTYSSVDLAQLIRGTAANFDSVAQERGIHLTIDVPAELASEIDEQKVRRVFLNLLSNAFNFTRKGGVIAVHLTTTVDPEHGTLAVLRVGDSGPGVLPEDRRRIFERFGQGTSSAAPRAAGTGLGLAIVRELIELHGGSVEVGDADEGGALFEARLPISAPPATVVLPAKDRSQPPPAVGEAAVEVVHRPSLAGRARLSDRGASEGNEVRSTVVLAEDNEDMRQLLVAALCPHYRVVEARDGEEALAQVRTQSPDLIISDVMMPKLTGEELVQRVRAVSALDGVPILLLTAKAGEEFRARMLRSGVQDYLLKPFEREELLARVHNLVANRRTHVLLQTEVEAQQNDVEALSREVVGQKRKLESALAAMNVAREAAERASRHKSDFLSLVSHEFRTPLTSIRLQLERLQRGRVGEASAAQAHIIAKIERSSARLLDMVESLLRFAKLEAGHVEVESVPIDIHEIAREIAEELRPRADEKGLDLVVEGVLEKLEVVSDPALVRLIITNLCDNAIKYTKRGAVRIVLERLPGGEVCVKVRDTGPGISTGDRDRVFLPFEQLEHVRHKQGSGVGLGLALVKRVSEGIHADVALESEPGAGSTFRVTFRRANDH